MVDSLGDSNEAIGALWRRRDRRLGAADAVYATVRSLIVSGLLAPATRLGEEEFAKQFHVSRTPVREAFLRLLAERLVERVGGRSLVVAGVTPEEILEIYVVRAAVDGLAARLAAEAARPQDLATLRWINDRLRTASIAGDSRMMATVNLEFHEAVCKAGRNAFLLELMQSVHDRVRRFPGTTFSYPGRAGAAVSEHDALIDAIAGRRAADAEQVARDHMARSMDVRILLLRDDAGAAGAKTA